MDLGLTDRVYLVTGASRGLGRACAQTLVDEGARVVLASRGVDAAAASQVGPPDRVVGVAVDLADPSAAALLADTANQRFGRLDGALVSVGGPPPTTAFESTDEQWRDAFESVFLGAVRMMRTVAAACADSPDGGSVVLVLSSSVKQPIPGLAISNGLRPGLAMTAKTFADELGPRGLRVNAVLPGRIATDRTKSLDRTPQDRERAEQAIPLRRYGAPEEFARAAVFLLSPAASYVTGTTLAVDGGATRTI